MVGVYLSHFSLSGSLSSKDLGAASRLSRKRVINFDYNPGMFWAVQAVGTQIVIQQRPAESFYNTVSNRCKENSLLH